MGAVTNGIDLFINREKVPGSPGMVIYKCTGCGRWVKWQSKDYNPTNRKLLQKQGT